MSRVNAGVFFAVVGAKGAKRLGRVRSAPTGFPDLIGVQRRSVTEIFTVNPDGFQPLEKKVPLTYGQAFAIETKTKDGRQSDEQLQFEEWWTKFGGIYILARSVKDVEDILGRDPALYRPAPEPEKDSPWRGQARR